MYISMGHMINLPTITFLNPHTNTINYMICLMVLTICFMIYGFDIIKNGYKNLIHKTPNMDTLVGIGVIKLNNVKNSEFHCILNYPSPTTCS